MCLSSCMLRLCNRRLLCGLFRPATRTRSICRHFFFVHIIEPKIGGKFQFVGRVWQVLMEEYTGGCFYSFLGFLRPALTVVWPRAALGLLPPPPAMLTDEVMLLFVYPVLFSSVRKLLFFLGMLLFCPLVSPGTGKRMGYYVQHSFPLRVDGGWMDGGRCVPRHPVFSSFPAFNVF
ncbi:hypothetical protein BDY21DRAFT_159616 [Lineolata rhizophorae]|uniref:Uncharacterized protein n=1 Tax=Lineolata rhizophorae TaxID=578093 RepID=A0A6A6P8W5_9PEZI|nr:hypothetical protein BDY21DRAFT_159616 [Lineolata rhizophorae]